MRRAVGLVGLALLALVGGCVDGDPARDAASPAGSDAAACDAVVLADDLGAGVTAAAPLVDGEPGPACLGSDRAVTDAWDLVAVALPPAARARFGLLVLFAPGDDATEGAVLPLADADGPWLLALVDDLGTPDVAVPTLVHEYAHVVAGGSDVVDESVPPERCDTFHNGDGCATVDGVLWAWVDTFWTGPVLGAWAADTDVADGDVEADPEESLDLCLTTDDFVTAYAATSPDEDLAESFAAFVLDVDLGTRAVGDKVAWFDDVPAALVVRDHVRGAGLDLDLGAQAYGRC